MDDFEFLLNPHMFSYLENHTTQEEALLKALDRETHLKVLAPRMISGAYQGRFLEMLSRMIQPFRILEVGAFTGYSAICLAKGLKKGGKLITIEHDRVLEDILSRYIEQSERSSCIEVLWGEAEKILPTMEEDSFDLIFLDADKENYSLYYPWLKRLLKVGAWMLVDNVLWNGKVWEEECSDKVTQQIRAFNDEVQADEEVENMTVFLRDGLTLIRKIK